MVLKLDSIIDGNQFYKAEIGQFFTKREIQEYERY